MIKGLIFDMDGLLFNSERMVQRTWTVVGREMGYPQMGEVLFNTLGFTKEKETVYFRETLGESFPIQEFHERTRKSFYDILDREGMQVKPGVREILSYGKEKGLKLAVATSSNKPYAMRLFCDAGIEGYFDGFVFGRKVTKSKPDPEIYLKACDTVGLSPEECIAFEDAPSGVRSAAAAGIRVIMIPDLLQPEEEIRSLAYRVCSSLEEAIPLLDELNK